MNTNIQQNYHDAIFFATSDSNNKEEFYLRPVEFKILLKLLYYSSNQSNITWSSEQISKHISIPVGSIDKSIQRLKTKKFIDTVYYSTAQKIRKRSITINWDKLSEINLLYLKSIDDTSSTKEEIIEDIITQPIQTIKKDIIVPDTEEKVYDDSEFPDEYKQESYTPEEYNEIQEHINSDVYKTKITKKEVKPHEDNIFNLQYEDK